MTFPWCVSLPVPTATISPCLPPPWTAWTTSARCPTTSPCTWTPATTWTRPAFCSANAACMDTLRTRGRRRPFGLVGVGTSNAPTPGRTPFTVSPAATSVTAPSRRLLRPCRHHHHRAQSDPAVLDNSPPGRTPEPPTMTTCLLSPRDLLPQCDGREYAPRSRSVRPGPPGDKANRWPLHGLRRLQDTVDLNVEPVVRASAASGNVCPVCGVRYVPRPWAS